MSELLERSVERKLWYDGPNYTADAVILDQSEDKVLLIERRDTGEWALPGGFIDPSDHSSLDAARREAEEEAGVRGMSGGALFYQGKTSDRRRSATSWIETSAHLFHLPYASELQAGDDARAAAWHNLSDLPPLYGAHRMLIERALDYSDSEQLFKIVDTPETCQPVDGGYMQYDKWIAEKDGERAFVKACPQDYPKYDELLLYIKKEAGVMAHLRQSGFRHVPDKSALYGDKLIMEALRPEDGWRWQADQSSLDAYINDTLAAFAALETTPLPPDTFNVEPSYESFTREGWRTFDGATFELLHQKSQDFLPHLSAETQKSALRMLANLPLLHEIAMTSPVPETFVFCHHDMRQANLAWHPKNGVKIIDWSWAGPGLPGSDSTRLLIDLHSSGYDVSKYRSSINPQHCLDLLGFWLGRSVLPEYRAEGLRAQQFATAVSAYELIEQRV